MEFQVDEMRIEDVPGVIALLSRELIADAVTNEDFRCKVLLDPNFLPEGAMTVKAGQVVVGFMLTILRREPLEDAPPDFDRGWITLFAVDRKFQRRGIGKSLLGGAIDFLIKGGAKSVWISPYAPNYFAPGIDEAAYPGAVEFLKKQGFDIAYRPLSMEADLSHFETPDWVGDAEQALSDQGVTVSRLDASNTEALQNFVRREFPGDWQRIICDEARVEREKGRKGEWENGRREDGKTGGWDDGKNECSTSKVPRSTSNTPTDSFNPTDPSNRTLIIDHRPSTIYVAMDDGRCIGFSRHDGERFGPFGVASSERGRGLGAVLLTRCMTSMRDDGMRRAWFMWTDDRAARLYSRLGFKEKRRFSVLKMMVDAEKRVNSKE